MSPPTDAGRFLLRPAQARDLPALEKLASARAVGISSLPTDRDALRQLLAQSSRAFAHEDAASGEEAYLFVLEDTQRDGTLVGTSGIAASAGFNERFFCYRNEYIVQASPELHARNRIHTLHLCHDLTGFTLLTGFHIDAALANTLAPQLLSRGRLLYIAQHPERFSDRIAAENPGLASEAGDCPFWDAVGRRFFNMDYPAAERLGGGRRHKAWIAGLMPQSPIYVPLLPEQAQWALGQLHPVGGLPFSILMDEGFDGETYVNLFDGGPTAEGRLPLLKTVARRRRVLAELDPGASPGASCHLVANTRSDAFRATLMDHDPTRQSLAMRPQLAAQLGVQAGQPLWVAGLDHQPADADAPASKR